MDSDVLWWCMSGPERKGEFPKIEFAIAIFAGLSALAAFLTYCATSRYTQITSDIFAANYRPYLIVEPLGESVARDDVRRRICIFVKLKNGGNVPGIVTDLTPFLKSVGLSGVTGRRCLRAGSSMYPSPFWCCY